MSELRENVFEMLDNDDNLIKQNEEENEKEKNNKDNNNKLNIDIERKDYNDNDNHINDNNNEDEEEDNSTWTDVSSSKVKKISSSSSTTKSENKDNNERGKSSPAVSNKSNNNNNSSTNTNTTTTNNNTNNSVTSTNDNQTGSQEPTKKKVLRFTRDELLALHRPTKCLAEMVDIPEVVTVESLEPECNKPFDPDEILKIWNNDANKARESNGGRGRGRGRGRNGDGDDNTYSNHHKDDDAQDIWDDVDSANSKTFDLADFSAATFKFSESAIKLTENTELYSKEGDETMESLMKDDHDFSGSLEEEPTQPVQKSGNEKGRNLLLQTLAVKTSTTDQKSPAIPFKATVQASTDDTLLDELIEEDGVNLSTISGDLKNDDSLTFDSADDLDIDGIIGGLTATISATTISTTSTNTTPVQNAPIVSNQGAPTAINRVLNPQTQQVNQAAYIQQQQQAQQAQVQAQQNILLYNQQPGSQIPRQPVPSPARPQQQQPQQPVIVPVVPQPPPTLVPDKWIYRDPHGNIQGPFEMTAMRRWLESGYFKENLPIKMTRWTTFHPLGIVYPNPESAFLGLIHEPMLPNNPVVIHSIPPQMIPQQQQQQHMMQGIPQQQQPTQQQQQQQQMSRTVEITPKQIDSDRLQSNDQGLNADDLIKGKRAIPKSAPSTLVVTTPLDKQDTINSNNSQIAAAVAAGSLTSNNSSSSTGVGVVAGTSSTNTTQQKTTKKVETISTTNVSTTTSKDSQNSNNDPSKQKPKQQSQPSQQSQSQQQQQQQQQQPQQSKPNIVTSTTASTNSSVTSESNNGDTSSNNNNNNNKKNDSQNANKKTKTTKKSSKDNTDGSDSSNNKKNDESSQPVQSAWTNKKGRDANEGKALSLTEIQQQEEAAKKQHAGESHPVENPPSSVRSFQLKNLLGVGGKEKGWSTNSTSNNNQSSNSLRDIQNEQEKINESKIAQQQQLHQQQQQQQQQGRGSSQWKAPAGVSNNSGMKSLVEIMEEEKNASGSTQSETKAGRTGSWAAKAGGPKSSTESSSIPPNWIATQSQKNNELSISDNSDSKIPPSPGKRVVTVTNNTSNSNTSNIIKPNSSSSSSQSQQQSQNNNNNSNNNNSKKSNSNSSNNSNSNSLAVGGDGIVEWSLLQLKRLSIENKSSTEDMALIEFCLTLKSAVEIREYLADYLGSTPQVSQFATEFIRRKEGKQPTQLRSTAGGTALTATILEKDKKNISLPTEAKKKKQKGKGQEF